MLTQFLLDNPLHAMGVWAGLLTLEYLLPIWGRRYLKRYADERIRPEFHRMNPIYLERGRGWLRYLFSLTFPCLVLGLGWLLYRPVYLWTCGALFFSRLVLIMRHKRSLTALFWMRLMPGSVEGGVRYTDAYIYRSSASDLVGFAALLGLAWAVAPHPILLGGSVTLVFMSLRHFLRGLRRANRA